MGEGLKQQEAYLEEEKMQGGGGLGAALFLNGLWEL